MCIGAFLAAKFVIVAISLKGKVLSTVLASESFVFDTLVIHKVEFL
jgi:hypothetical protein